MTLDGPQPVEPALAPGVYRALLEQLPEGVVVADAQARLVLTNQRAERLTGIPLSTLLGSDIRETLPLVSPDGRSFWATDNPWDGLHTRSGSPERRMLLPGGHSVLMATRHIRGGAPRRALQWLVLTMRSATVRDRIEAETSALVTTVAHELRAPLGAVRGFSRTLRTRWEQLREDQKRWMLGAIETDAARLQRLVGELLDISRIDTGRLELRRRPVDLAEIVRACVDRLVNNGEDPARFRVVQLVDDVELWGDADRLTQVVSNLLENAVGHGAGKITTTIDVVGDEVRLDIADEGPGIAPEHRSLVFSRFWQAGRRGNGNGLGLFVVQGLAQAHGGHVEVLETEHGATFCVTLPGGVPDHLK
ncbi:PAS domain-containing sensor histidine kinase [Flexivirga sp. ID2601S]|uniref:histidine kinase n=1 Tax=Flexivirga aerilata TaxID=1656889 RepID=A0A849AJR1_9MICO|nr:PAS domain-containing sensor histidine kinase [Flexivirga aerilata]